MTPEQEDGTHQVEIAFVKAVREYQEVE